MDTVIGVQTSSKVLLTLIIVDTNFMFIRLLDKKKIESINKQINFFKSKLGLLLYSKIFEDDIIFKLESNINNIPRKKLKGKSPYQLTKEVYPELIDALNYPSIEEDDITLNINDYIK